MNIPGNFQESHAQVRALIADFRAREAFYLSSEYQEAEARQDFIDKFWIALGWDVRHDREKNPYEQEVKVERGVQVGGGLAQKRADYAFSLGPDYRTARFYCEAKKPSVKIREDRDAHFQTHRYGYGSKSKVSVLFDFHELVIVDCRRKPKVDFALTSAHRSYCYGDFEDEAKFGEIYWLFSREAVGTGKLDAYVAAMPKLKKVGKRQDGQRGSDTQPFDDAFLDDLERYRGELARMLKNRNADLDGGSLTELVQRILDRLVFLRFLEDKLIETEHSVHQFTKAAPGQVWPRFLAASRKLDGRYNGVVFKFHAQLDDGSLVVDDADFLAICEELEHEHSSYDFNTIPIHILGSIYERFLGTVITTTDKRAKPELKPGVRKAGGVYYTPEYIVRYICEQTVGKLIEGRTPAQVEKMRFADIACGSGSFLLGIFDILLRHHGRWYAANPDAARKENLAPSTKNKKRRKEFIPAVVEREGLLCLTLEKKRQILLNNIYGVDLDPQAVEVAQLSLYLKLLEDETTASTRDDYLAFHEALLPPLGGNIKCGNSLVGTDILYGQFEFSAEEERKLRPMDFESAFPQVFAPKWSGADRVQDDTDGSHVDVGPEPQREVVDYTERKPVKEEKPKAPPVSGGFDAIVGNPPYVRIQGFPPAQISYFKQHYSAATGNFDLYVNFIERAYRLIGKDGCVGQIVPNKFFKTDYGIGLRGFLSKENAVSDVVDFGASQVFEATTYTALLFLRMQSNQRVSLRRAEASEAALRESPSGQVLASSLTRDPWGFENPAQATLRRKLRKAATRLLDLPAEMSRGSSSGDDEVFLVPASSGLEEGILRIPLFASDFSRYLFAPKAEWRIIFPYEVGGAGTRLISSSDLSARFPRAFAYLREHSAPLRKRKQFQEWFGYSAARNLELHERAQIAVPLLANRGLFALIPPTSRGSLCPMASGGFTVTISDRCAFRPEYVLGVLNSRLLFWELQQVSNLFRGGWITCTKQYLGELPIFMLDLAIPAQKAQHDRMVQLVEQMLKTKAQVSTAKTESERTYLEDKCAGLDRQIDQLTYDLYDLIPEEVALVEKGS